MKAKKIAKIQARATKVTQSLLGDHVQLWFRDDGLNADIRFCARIGCEGCNEHVFSVGRLGDPDLKNRLTPIVYEHVARTVLSAPAPRPIGFGRGA